MLEETMHKMPGMLKFLVATYLLLDPIYFWASGLPQVSDFVLLILIIWTFASTHPYDHAAKQFHIPLAFLGTFVYYALLVNLVWSLVYPGTDSFITGSMYLIFNFAVLITFVRLYVRYRRELSKFVYLFLSVALFIQGVSTLLVMGSQGIRTSTFFNNPNQLGYYALLAASIITLLNIDARRRSSLHVMNLLTCLFLATASLSRAAIVPVIVIVLFNLLFEVRERKVRLRLQAGKIILALSALGVTGYLFQSPLRHLVESWQTRLESKGMVDDNELSNRGYDRIIDNPQHWAFGAGNGSPERFNVIGEVHSTLGQLFFSYGLIGSLLLVTGIAIIMWRNPSSVAMFSAILIYGLSHNGIRDGNLWIFFALALAVTFVETRSGELRVMRQTGKSRIRPINHVSST